MPDGLLQYRQVRARITIVSCSLGFEGRDFGWFWQRSGLLAKGSTTVWLISVDAGLFFALQWGCWSTGFFGKEFWPDSGWAYPMSQDIFGFFLHPVIISVLLFFPFFSNFFDVFFSWCSRSFGPSPWGKKHTAGMQLRRTKFLINPSVCLKGSALP